MMIQVQEVTTKKELKKFVTFPIKLYRHCSNFIPSLIADEMNVLSKDKNPVFDFCEAKYWLAYQNSKLVGRIAAIINHEAIKRWGIKAGRFGYVDFIESYEVAKALLNTAEVWLKFNGMTKIIGPIGFTDLDPAGMLTEGFETIGTMTTIYNYAYYPKYLKQLGYAKDVTWYEYELHMPKGIPSTINAIADRALRMYPIKVLQLKNIKEIYPYISKLFSLLNTCYEELYQVTHITKKQMSVFINQYIRLLTPDFIKLIIDENDDVVSFGICFPSLSKALKKAKGKLFPKGFFHILRALRKNNRAELVLIAVHPKYQASGLNAVLFREFINSFHAFGIEIADCNPQLESNIKSRSQWKVFKHRQHKARCSFKKDLV